MIGFFDLSTTRTAHALHIRFDMFMTVFSCRCAFSFYMGYDRTPYLFVSDSDT